MQTQIETQQQTIRSRSTRIGSQRCAQETQHGYYLYLHLQKQMAEEAPRIIRGALEPPRAHYSRLQLPRILPESHSRKCGSVCSFSYSLHYQMQGEMQTQIETQKQTIRSR